MPLDPKALFDEVRSSAKYAAMDEDLVRQIATEESAHCAKMAVAVKTTRTRLHQLAGAYYDKPSHYAQLSKLLKSLPSNSSENLRTYAKSAMRLHASTQERLPILVSFYEQIFAKLPLISSVIDLGCGLNPLSLPWMPHYAPIRYRAYDVVRPMLDFLNDWFSFIGIDGMAQSLNLAQTFPAESADLAFLLKLLPLLDQIDKSINPRLLRELPARHLVISFPLKSLGGRSKGMGATYEKRFGELTAGLPFKQERLTFSNELVFILTRQDV